MFAESFEKYNIVNHGVRLPKIKIDEIDLKDVGLTEGSSHKDYLLALARKGFKARKEAKEIDLSKIEEYGERVKKEIDLFEELGFTDYILLIYKIIQKCDKKEIPVGAGRGSAAGCLVFYFIGVTNVDPISNGLYLERFMSKTRAKKNIVDGITYIDGSLAPDVDCDIDYYRRGEVIKDLYDEYKGKTAKIGTLSTFSSKICIKECGKVRGKKEEEMKMVSSMISSKFGVVDSLAEALQNEKELVKWVEENQSIYNIALKLEDLIHGKGVHASGVAVSYEDIFKRIPLELSKEGDIVTSYDMKAVQEYVIKVDILGLKTLSVVSEACKNLGIDFKKIDINDQSIYDYLKDFKNEYGIFQLESSAQYNVTKKIAPKNFEELSAALAISRPGAIDFLQQYCDYTRKGILKPIHPIIDEVLGKTGNCCLFQESLMQLIHKIGFSLEDAEIVRRIVGKKNKEKMVEWEEKIKSKCKENNIDPAVGEMIWKIANDSASYSFNKCIWEEETVDHKIKGKIKLKDVVIGDEILAFDVKNNKNHYVTVKNIYNNKKDCYLSNFDGYLIVTSTDHKFLCADRKMWALKSFWKSRDKKFKVFVNKPHKRSDYLKELLYCEHKGLLPTIDLEVDHKDHNFYCNDIVVSNSHASAYATLSAATIYIKSKYPKQFFLALLKMSKFEQDSQFVVSQIIHEMRNFGVPILPPHLFKSDLEFSVEEGGVRFGLSAIKGIAGKTLNALNEFRRPTAHKYEMFQLAKQSGLNIAQLSSLIQAGCMDDAITSRTRMVLEAQLWWILTDKEKKLCIDFGHEYNYDLMVQVKDYAENKKNEKNKTLIKESRFETIKKKYEPFKKIYLQNKKNEDFANWFFEKKYLGFSWSQDLSHIFSRENKRLIPISDLKTLMKEDVCEVIGRIIEVKNGIAKNAKKTQYLKVQLEDDTAITTAMMFNRNIEDNEANNGKLSSEDIVLVRGKWMGDTIFANQIIPQQWKIFTKLSEIKLEISLAED